MYKAGNAVDRNITTCMRTDAIGVNSRDQAVWWRVDLGGVYNICLLYTSDAADDMQCVDLGGRRIIKKSEWLDRRVSCRMC